MTKNSDNWITVGEAAKILNCSPGTVIGLIKAGYLKGEKRRGRWMIRIEDVYAWRDKHAESTTEQSIDEKTELPPIDVGMIEVSIALVGISAALAALLPAAVPPNLYWAKQIMVVFVGGLSVYSAYSAMWLLAVYSLKKTSKTGIPEIWELLGATYLGPYWFMALGLVLWLMLSFLVFYIAIAGD